MSNINCSTPKPLDCCKDLLEKYRDLERKIEVLNNSVAIINEDGEIVISGPKGDKGDKGSQGLQGPQGPAGPPSVINLTTAGIGAATYDANTLTLNIPVPGPGLGTVTTISANNNVGQTWTIQNPNTNPSINLALTSAAVSLSNVDNTSDVNKPISSATQTALNLKESTSNKGVANGYVPLQGNSLISSIYLPSYIDTIVEYATYSAFPGTGVSGTIYLDKNTGVQYRWSGTQYSSITSGAVQTVNGFTGNVNLLFQAPITLTTNSASQSTFINNVLNIPIPQNLVETQVVNGNFSKVFNTGTIINTIFVEPPGSGVASVSIGTTIGGSEIFDSIPVDGTNPTSMLYTKKFKTTTTWYFSGIASNTTITYIYSNLPTILS